MKYPICSEKIALKDRQALNDLCLQAIREENPSMTMEQIYHRFTGCGGLHGLHYVDFGNYHDFFYLDLVVSGFAYYLDLF